MTKKTDEAVQIEQEEGLVGKVKASVSEDLFSAYANGVGVAHTFFDFQLHFSEVIIRGADDVTAEQFATIMMSPQHAKMLLMHFAQNLALYESKFGEINIPAQFAASENKAVNVTE